MTTQVTLRPLRCPTCCSPAPHLHPALQHEGEVHICADEWHNFPGVEADFAHGGFISAATKPRFFKDPVLLDKPLPPAPVTVQTVAERIVRHTVEAVIELLFARHDLADADDTPLDASAYIDDLVGVCMGFNSCLEADDQDEHNTEFLWIKARLGELVEASRTNMSDAGILDRESTAQPLTSAASKAADADASELRITLADEPQRCHAGRDGDCIWSECPQTQDGEPVKSGRHCPLDHDDEEETLG